MADHSSDDAVDWGASDKVERIVVVHQNSFLSAWFSYAS